MSSALLLQTRESIAGVFCQSLRWPPSQTCVPRLRAVFHLPSITGGISGSSERIRSSASSEMNPSSLPDILFHRFLLFGKSDHYLSGLILSRGHYCPKDHQQHLEMAEFYPKIAVAYTQIVTISTDNILETNEFRDAVGAQWTFLSDSGRKIHPLNP